MEHSRPTREHFPLPSGQISRKNSCGAFALVSTLVVLGLALVVVLWMVVQVGVEVRSSHAALQRSQAQANALAGMQMALGALQEEAGADQRITARAELLDSDDGTLALDGVTQPFWTGIWRTGPNEPDVTLGGNSPQRELSLGSLTPTLAEKSSSASWMVSKPKGTAALDPRSFTATVGSRVADVAAAAAQSGVSEAGGAAPTAAVLAKNIGRRDPSAGSAGNPGYVVAAPLVDILDVSDNKLRGRYAYWISDEGVKAKVNLVGDGVLSTEPADRRQRHFTSPGGTAPDQALEPGFRATLRNQVSGDATALGKVQLPESLTFLLPGSSFPESAEGFKLSWPDFTTHSHGVLGDVKNGGLKKDLTAAFESPQEFAEFIDSNPTKTGILLPPAEQKKRVWSTESPAAELQDNGSYWASFYFHYNLYKASMPSYRTGASVGTAPKGVGGPSTTTPEVEVRSHYLGNYLSVNGAPSPEGRLFHLAPAMLGVRYEVGISSEEDTPGSGTYSLRLHHFPAIIYHNPYNVRLVPTIGSENKLTFRSNVFIMSSIFAFKINSNNMLESQLTFRSTGPGTTPELIFLEVKPTELVFEPGEIKIFGLASDDPKNSLSAAANSPLNPHVLTGLTTQDIDLQANKSARMSGAAVLDGLNNLNPTDTISIERKSWRNTDRLRANDYRISCTNMKQWPDRPTNNYDFFGTYSAEYLPEFIPQDTERADIFGGPVSVSSLNPAVGGGSIQRIQGFTAAAKGYTPERDTKAAMFGGSGPQFFPGNVIKAVNFADLRNRVGTNFSPDEEFAFTTDGASFYGLRDAGRPGGSTRVILKELPLQPMLSLGQYQHVDDGFYSYASGPGRSAKSSFIPVGGSLPNPSLANQVEVEKTLQPYTGAPQIEYDSDTAYLNNRELFDRTFFSTIPPADNLKVDGSVNGTRYPAEWQDFTQASVDAGRTLLNSRLIFTPRPDGTTPRLAGTDSERPLRSWRHAAAGLLVDGAFNVNSTSVAAWRAILSSLRFSNQAGGNPVPRFTTSLVTENNYAEGMRVLTDDQVDRLAREIVNQVKLRGPFLSLGDFINRRRVAGALGERGALQAAIDASGINNDALAALGTASNKVVSDAMLRTADFEAMLAGYMPANTAMGAPGVIMQHDLLQALAPIMVARSDTFVIRAYGEAVNPATGAAESSAWCEAVVQRVPEYVDQSDPRIAALGSATHPDTLDASSANARLGRRFKVVSFRWLGESEL